MGLRRENILHSSLITAIFRSTRKKIDNSGLALYYLELPDGFKAGVMVYKKVGKAVRRNHIKRIIKSFLADNLKEIKSGHYFFVVKEDKPDTDLISLALHLMLKGKLLKDV
ncbi:MAG: Ribonuclease P protein component [candidate division WS2 bacterium]|uniref:Ribonuclease P protein component n=1 Tax=Psychracetigena formicireducens TaxID=2986056 RepID=A0A9E2BG41_PSYF1|nr:Ribonuclease P protein component [Candidatus Psychracetigena formicireducens]MBT9144872.1 Ribonuclease P protein component [Candidatus Psychracetigena formicireducens]MBT9150405.1 Ribonuclease P protein component [Candidatus Psychracetigena formicireducens]